MYKQLFSYKEKQILKKVPQYGYLHICGGMTNACGLCENEWNYKYEYPHIVEIRKLLTRPDLVGVDIGAHIGLYGLSLRNNITKMYSFEPLPYVFEALVKNSALYPSIIPFNLACGEECSNATDIRVVNLDSFFDKDMKIDFLKLDVEGQEVSILKGAQKILSNQDEIVALIEFDVKHFAKYKVTSESFFDALKLCGFDCYVFYEKCIKPNMSPNYMTNLIIHRQNGLTKIKQLIYYN